MRLRTLVTSFILAALGCAPELVSAQQPGQLTRVAPTTGLADSSLFICSDSTKALTRACKFSDVQKRLAFKTFDSLVTSTLRATGAITVGSCVGCGGGTTYPLAAPDGSAAAPSIAFANSAGTGFRLIDNGTTDTLSVSTNGVESLKLTGGATPSLIGGAGNFTFRAGTGASRTLTFQVSTAGGAAGTFLTGNADQSTTINGGLTMSGGTGISMTGATTLNQQLGLVNTSGNVKFGVNGSTANAYFTNGHAYAAVIGASGTNVIDFGTNNALVGSFFGDTLILMGHARQVNLTAAAGTPGSICYITATGEITKNAATSCVVSSIRFKTNVKPLALDSAREIVRRLTPVTYEMKDGGRPSLHVIAEQADSISKRLSFYDDKGRVNSVDDGAILSAVLLVVKDQQQQIDALHRAAHPGQLLVMIAIAGLLTIVIGTVVLLWRVR